MHTTARQTTARHTTARQAAARQSSTRQTGTRRSFLAAMLVAGVAVSCGSSSTPAGSDTGVAGPATVDVGPGVRLVSAQEGAQIQSEPPAGLVVLDVRTPEEFAQGHVDGAIMIDFYRDDFATELAALDPNVPYLLYCRSGNRSGQTAALMAQLGFSDVADVDGGIVAWDAAGLPTVAG